ncbi:MAG TPA: adenosylcobinamide-phosphate synthase CbiB [Xanthobacteraceae bacterium]|jgi:adenosylcobinamide-phosphate synthase
MTLTLLALLIEVTFGYPGWLTRTIGHPVTWVGRLIDALDRGLNREDMNTSRRRAAGAVALVVTVAAAAVAGGILALACRELAFGIAIAALAASTLFAQRSLYAHVERVAIALETKGLTVARQAVSHIVGRDPESLDEAGVARAAIESLAENFSDGVVAPAFWLAAAGLAGGAAYKAINTADSMIGHRTQRHGAFGWAAARLDDLVNLPASRLSAVLIVAAAAVTPGASWRKAWRAMARDARHHRSPNAGYPEAAMAGALDLALAGPRSYGGIEIADALMGNGRRCATAADIRAALSLYIRADAILIAGVAALALLAAALSGGA